MATKNFLSSRKKIKLYAAIATIFLISCSSFQRKNTQSAGSATQPVQPVGAPQTSGEISGPPPLAPQLPQASGHVLPVGVYFGPGGLKSFADIGVIRALQKAQIPIVTIGGMEWGSVAAASYALSRGANEVEWEMMKLRRDQLPSVGLLSRQFKPKDPQDLGDFLGTVFGNRDLGSARIPFSCPVSKKWRSN